MLIFSVSFQFYQMSPRRQAVAGASALTLTAHGRCNCNAADVLIPCSCPRNPLFPVSQLPRLLSSSPSSPSYSALKIHGRIFKSNNKQALKASSSSSSPVHRKGFLMSSLKIQSSFLWNLDSDDPSYGPPIKGKKALLLLGFDVQEASKVQQLLKDMDGDFLQPPADNILH
ncbi:hypothetical protein Dimus_021266 [Dionaea muscipula]